MVWDRIQTAAAAIADTTGVERHDAVVVLGSGLGGFAAGLDGAVAVPYGELPGFPQPKAVGHAGTAYSVQLGPNRVLVYAGRAHVYEGHDLETVVLPVRAAIAAGARTVVLTNASGGLARGLRPGDLAMIVDHINVAARNPLVGENDERLGPRFPDLTDVYTPRLRRAARAIADEMGLPLPESIYAWWLGPSFETPAEIRMLHAFGADIVGMSTVPEAIAARHMGADIAAFSLVSNKAAGYSDDRITAEEVIETATRVGPTLQRFLAGFLAREDLVER